MAGMLQILTGLLAFYLVVKGIEVLQIGLASARPNRRLMIGIGFGTLTICILVGIGFVRMQNEQAAAVGQSPPAGPSSATP